MRRLSGLLLGLVVLAAPARAEQPRCPLPIGEYMAQFGAMRERPRLGVESERDSLTGSRHVLSVVAGSPADRAGDKAGDILQKVGGVDPQVWFASKAGWKANWKDGDKAALIVSRNGHDRTREMALGHVPEETLAAMIGIHVLEGHLAHTDEGQAHEER